MSEIKPEKKSYQTLIFLLFLTGFLAGTLIPNIIWKTGWHKQTMSACYLFHLSLSGAVSNGAGNQSSDIPTGAALGLEYFRELVKIRGSLFLLSALSGLTSFGIPWAVMLTLFFGAQMGLLMTLSILEFGIRGGLLGLSFFLPQILCYLPVLLGGAGLICAQSVRIWKNHGLYPRATWQYLLKTLRFLVIFTIGIALEAWINPNFVRILLKYANY